METNCLHKHQFTPVNYTIHFATFQSLVVKTFLILDNGPIITTFCWKICGKTWPNSKAIVQHTAEYDYIDIDLMSAWSFFFHAKASPILDDIHDILRTQSSHDQFICSNYRYNHNICANSNSYNDQSPFTKFYYSYAITDIYYS